VSGKSLILSLSKLDSIYTNDGLLAPTIDSAHIHIQSDLGDPFRSPREVEV
jgi:hypothetical protein